MLDRASLALRLADLAELFPPGLGIARAFTPSPLRCAFLCVFVAVLIVITVGRSTDDAGQDERNAAGARRAACAQSIRDAVTAQQGFRLLARDARTFKVILGPSARRSFAMPDDLTADLLELRALPAVQVGIAMREQAAAELRGSERKLNAD